MAPPTHLKGVRVAACHWYVLIWAMPLYIVPLVRGNVFSFSPHSAVQQASHPNLLLSGFRASHEFPPSFLGVLRHVGNQNNAQNTIFKTTSTWKEGETLAFSFELGPFPVYRVVSATSGRSVLIEKVGYLAQESGIKQALMLLAQLGKGCKGIKGIPLGRDPWSVCSGLVWGQWGESFSMVGRCQEEELSCHHAWYCDRCKERGAFM